MNRLMLFALLAPLAIYSQDHIKPYKLNKEGRLYYDLIFEDSTKTQDELFIKGKLWIAKNFKSGKEVEIFSDKEAGTIVGKGSVQYYTTLGLIGGSEDYIGYVINILVKPGKAKIVLDNFTITTYGNRYIPETPSAFECYYYKGCDSTKKPRAGGSAHKEKKAAYIASIAEDWKKSMIAGNEYEKF